MNPFDLTDPLPRGTTVLEASAGTGKTYAIAALTARYLAEGRATIGDLLLVTFSRAATAELRGRVRERIKDAAGMLRAAADGVPARTDDPVDRALLGDGSDAAERAARLEDAFRNFDAATIMTTHEFCHGMIHGLGILAEQEPQSTLVEDLSGLVDEVSADLYLQRYAEAPRPPFPYGEARNTVSARALARDAVEFDGEIGPGGLGGVAGERVAFALAVRDEMAVRKKRHRVFSFDDQLRRLRAALYDPETGARARAKLAARFPVVLIDEFQDTDPVQWQIVQAAFDRPADEGDSGHALVLIGDPKQAIYAFRGADVHAYAAAVDAASARTTLGVNFRSDPGVVAGVGALFRGVALGSRIGVPPVAADRTEPRLIARPGTPWAAGVQVRAVTNDAPLWPSTANARIASDLVGVVTTLLAEGSPLGHGEAALRPGDIAVLVRSNYRGRDLAEALAAAGVAATFSGTRSVFDTDEAGDWATLLAALDQPRRPYLQRAVLTDFMGGTLTDLARATDDDWARWSVRLRSWAAALHRGGVPALMAAIERETAMTQRLLRRAHGERAVTDHRHLAELLHGRGHGRPAHARELADWLRSAIDEAADAERTRRLETDDAAVQVMTIHRAKGLQFPVVLLPEASSERDRDDDDGGRLLLPAREGRRLDVGGSGTPGREQRWKQVREDAADESLRALYVGLTRAESHVVAWWAHAKGVAASPLHRLLHARHDPGAPARPDLHYPPRKLAAHGSPTELTWLAEAGISVVEVTDPQPRRVVAAAEASPLSVRPFDREIDGQWRRTSYSGLTADAHALPPEAGLIADEEPTEVAVEPDPALARPSPMATLPSGPAFGTLVHAIYERLDARGPAWRDALNDVVADEVPRWPVAGVEAPALAEALAPSLETPLGPLAEGTTLRSFGPGTRLTELDFEFPLDNPAASLADLARLIARALPPGDPLEPYPPRLAGPALTTQRLHGFLTGSIDAVLRLPSGAHLVVDYKTNRLGAVDSPPEELTLGHYTPPALAEAMMASHYPLQALLYSVALHRFLGLRLPGYDPERHLGGVAYLFVRGMAGPGTPLVGDDPLGVFSWRPSAGLVRDVSELLAGGAP